MELRKRLGNLISDKESLNQRISEFKNNIKAVFMKELLDELDKTLRIDNETFLAFDMFNAQMESREEERLGEIRTLISFYEIPVAQNSSQRNIFVKHYSGFKAQLTNQCSCFLMTLMLLLRK